MGWVQARLQLRIPLVSVCSCTPLVSLPGLLTPAQHVHPFGTKKQMVPAGCLSDVNFYQAEARAVAFGQLILIQVNIEPQQKHVYRNLMFRYAKHVRELGFGSAIVS